MVFEVGYEPCAGFKIGQKQVKEVCGMGAVVWNGGQSDLLMASPIAQLFLIMVPYSMPIGLNVLSLVQLTEQVGAKDVAHDVAAA